MKRLLKIVVFVVITFVFYNMFSLNETEIALDQHQCKNLKKQNDVLMDNIVWQVLETPQGRLNLFNAYLDMRFNQKYVRINTIGPNFNESFEEIYCQFWFEDESIKPEIVKVFKFVNLWISSGIAGKNYARNISLH